MPHIGLPQLSVNLFALAMVLGVLLSCSGLFLLAQMVAPLIEW